MIKGLPKKLHDLRIMYGYSQKQVAKKLGVSPSVISSYENGDRTPSTEVLLSLSYLYNCSADYLLGRISNVTKYVINTEGLTDNQICALANLIESMKK